MEKNKSKITIVSGIYPPDHGGPATFIPILSRYLSNKGLTIQIITLTDMPYGYDKSDCNLNIKFISRRLPRVLRQIYTIFHIFKSACSSDCVFSNTLDFETSIACIIAQRKHIVKIVGDLAWERARLNNSYDGTIDDYQKINYSIVQWARNYYRNFPLLFASKLVVPSYYLSKIAGSWLNGKRDIDVIYNSVDGKKLFKKGIHHINNDYFHFLVVGRLVSYKNIDKIIIAFSEVEIPYKLTIIGDGPDKNYLKNLALELNVKATFTGHIDNDDVIQYLVNADCLINNASYEGLSHVILEALTNRTLVYASNVGGNPELVRDGITGFLFECNNKDQLIKLIHKSPSYLDLNFLDEAYYITVDRFSQSKMLEQYFLLFRKYVDV